MFPFIFLQGRPCQLIVHLDRGFSLLDSSLGTTSKIIWTYPFEKLKGSADDGVKFLYLEFCSDDGLVEVVSFLKTFSFLSFKAIFFLNRSWIWNVARSQSSLCYTTAYRPKFIL